MASILTGTDPMNYPTVAADRVFPSRVVPLFSKVELPCILVYTNDEPVEEFNSAPRRNKRTIRLAVEIVCTMADNIDDALDDACEQVENLLMRNDTLNGKASDVRLTNTEIVTLPDGDKPIGAAKLSFDVEYYETVNLDPTDPLITGNVGWDLAQPDGKIEAEDKINFPQPTP